MMKYRKLRDLTVSAVGLGCMGMSHAYGPAADPKAMRELIASAVDMGYTFFDTAEIYGTPDDPHANEKLVGSAIRPYRDKVVIASKFGITFDKNDGNVNHRLIPDSRPKTIRRAVEGSLKRLGTDHIDLYYQHRQDPNVPVEEVAGVMGDLIKEGKILHWGLSAVDEDTIRRANAVTPVTAVQNRYSMMYRDTEKLFPVLEELNIGLVPFSPMANGFLSGRYTASSQYAKGDMKAVMPQFQKENMKKNQELLDYIEAIAKDKNATAAQISLAWMICKKPYIAPIPGSTKITRVKENGDASEVVLTPEEVAEIDRRLDSLPHFAVYDGSAIKRKDQ
jgi:aryl-alcohol dehydrogenase-like predicted oxidoreductase